jgi:hypothetical protein
MFGELLGRLKNYLNPYIRKFKDFLNLITNRRGYLGGMSFIDGLTGFFELMAVLVITYKIEQNKVSRKLVVKGVLLAIGMVFFMYFIRNTIEKSFPFISSFFIILMYTLLMFILFNRFYRNNFVRSFLKTTITSLIMVICQLTLLPFLPILSSIIGYELMMDIMGFIAQIWIVTFMFFIYPRFSNRVNKMITDFSNYPKYVFGSFLYLVSHVIIVTYFRSHLIDNIFALILMIFMTTSIFIALIIIIYRYFIKSEAI